MNADVWLIIIGWGLGLLSSLGLGLFMFWLEGKRELRTMRREQSREDIRTARNWAANGKKESMRGFDLAGANLSGKDLAGADLEEANFEGAQMWGTNLSGANLIRARFHNAKLIGVNLHQADLRLAEFTGAILGEVDFSDTKLRRTKLANCREIVDCIWTNAQIDETTEISDALALQINQNVEEPLS